jgi:hypothetical protein
MEESVLIGKVVNEVTSKIPYCGSCMGGCDKFTKFICLGMNMTSINKFIETHPDLINEWEKDEDRKISELMRMKASNHI